MPRITSVAVNLFILAQERALFDENNEDEIITSKVLKQTAKKDMKIIQPMLNAIRNNDFAAMYKYEDIMINLDELMMNHKRNTQYEGKVKDAMKERKNTIAYKQQELIESLSSEVAAIGIFESLSSTDILKATQKIVEDTSADTDEIVLKSKIIPYLIEMNKKIKQKEKSTFISNKVLPLLSLREQAVNQKRHCYEVFKLNDYIKNINEFY